MVNIYNIATNAFGDSAEITFALLVFLTTGILTFGVMAAVHARGDVKRRAAGIAEYSGERQAEEQGSLRDSSRKAVQRILDYTNKHYSTAESGDAKALRRRLIQAGIYDARAVAFFFVARTALAVAVALAAFIILPMLVTQSAG